MGQGLIIGAALGECVHVAGVVNFLRLAEEAGYRTVSLGPAVSIKELIDACLEASPAIVAVGYRLTPQTAQPLLDDLAREVRRAGLRDKRFVFGGTKPVCEVAQQVGLFEKTFSGEDPVDEVIAYLRGGDLHDAPVRYPQTLLDRVAWKKPFPIIRHHFGQPTLDATLQGAVKIAEAKVCDVISIGTDQAAQESFFRPEDLVRHNPGAGGVPVRRPEDLRALHAATRCGNYPLLRCYSGTRDLISWAQMLQETIANAWCAVPLTWYSVLDRRGPRSLRQTIVEAQEIMAWHGRRNIPLESNESHHWSLRDAPDTVAVVMAFLAAYNAKQNGVRHYVSQYMFNTPKATSPLMDLGKMLAKQALIAELESADFKVLTETRAGLSSYPPDSDRARGHLVQSTTLQMAMEPDIVHVVAYCEADHAAGAEEVIASCKMADRAIENVLQGHPDMTLDLRVQARKEALLAEARTLLAAVRRMGAARGGEDPWSDPETLAASIELGLIDAPHLRGNPAAAGTVETRMIDGACVAVDKASGQPLTETERIARLVWPSRVRTVE